jgi:hypothetical protein
MPRRGASDYTDFICNELQISQAEFSLGPILKTFLILTITTACVVRRARFFWVNYRKVTL